MIFDNVPVVITMDKYPTDVGRRSGHYSKKVLCVTTGQTYVSTVAAADAVGVCNSAISSACRGLPGHHFCGYYDQESKKMIPYKAKGCKLTRLEWKYL